MKFTKRGAKVPPPYGSTSGRRQELYIAAAGGAVVI